MFILKASESEHLIKIKAAVINGVSAVELTETCKEISPFIDDKSFVYTYAACLLASRHRIVDAMLMFALNIEDTFCKIMHEYLKETGKFELADKVFKSSDPYDIYTQTEFFKIHQMRALKHIRKFAIENPPPKSTTPVTILDIGVGNGEFIAKIVNEIIPLHNIKSLRLIIVDQSEDMLAKAKEYCQENISIQLEIMSICCKIQEIISEQFEIIQEMKPIWFMNAGLSIHHMPKEMKIPMLKNLRKLSPKLILTEVNWNHDLPEKDSPELIYSVTKSYGVFSKSILSLPVSEQRRKLCLYNFPVAEAINIIKQDRENRIDYHTTIREWRKIANEAGFKAGEASPNYVFDNEPFSFVMEML